MFTPLTLANCSIAHRIILTTDGSHLNVYQRKTETGDPLIILLSICKNGTYTLMSCCCSVSSLVLPGAVIQTSCAVDFLDAFSLCACVSSSGLLCGAVHLWCLMKYKIK